MSDNPMITIENAESWHVCGLVIQADIAKFSQVKTALLAIPQTEIPLEDAQKGKLVVVMQSHDQYILLDNIEKAREFEGVLDLSLTYHEQDERH